MLRRSRKQVIEAKDEPLELRREKGKGNTPVGKKRGKARYRRAPRRERRAQAGSFILTVLKSGILGEVLGETSIEYSSA